MASNRKPNPEPYRSSTSSLSTPLAAETLRQGSQAGNPAGQSASGEEKISLFWRVFGGTILSIAALVVVTIYQQFTNTLSDLRAGMTHLNEAQADMVKKEDAASQTTAIWNVLKDVSTAVPTLKTSQSALENRLQAAEQDRKDLAREVQQLHQEVAELKGHLDAVKK